MLTYVLIIQVCYGWNYSLCRESVAARGLSFQQCQSEMIYRTRRGQAARCRPESN